MKKIAGYILLSVIPIGILLFWQVSYSKWQDKECKKECGQCGTYVECDECFYEHNDVCE